MYTTIMSPHQTRSSSHLSVFFFNDPATTEIYTLSLHDALPIYRALAAAHDLLDSEAPEADGFTRSAADRLDRKSTRLNSSHSQISYAVFCLKKKTAIHLLSHL